MSRTVLSLLAHPDDAEILCAGALLRLVQEQGWTSHLATMTAGDCGSANQSAETISQMRRKEAEAAADLLGAQYHCMEEQDLRVFYDGPTLAKVTRLIRSVQPDLVFTHSPADYMLDHEMTSQLVRAACFNAPIPNYPTQNQQAISKIPFLYYCDPIEGVDQFGAEIRPTTFVDITSVIELKQEMLACHASQREWLREHHGMDQYIVSMLSWAEKRGAEMGVSHAEGFRQHRGHAYPSHDILSEILSN